MARNLSITLAQLDYIVGDIDGNKNKIANIHAEAERNGVDIVVCSELAIIGYPPEDLIFRHDFQQRAMQAVMDLAKLTRGKAPALLVGGVWFEDDEVYNAAFLLDEGDIHSVITKHSLPNYGVFDEQRVFVAGEPPEPVEWRGINLGVLVCRDLWDEDIGRQMGMKGAELMLVLNASPYDLPKMAERMEAASKAVKAAGIPLVYVNQAGGQDELVFDGRSFIMSADKSVPVMLPAFSEASYNSGWEKKKDGWVCTSSASGEKTSSDQEIYSAMVSGVRDYVNKNGFNGAILGLSGGMDSALVAAIAVDALGPERVHAVMLPSRITSHESMEDAAECAAMLGMSYEVIPIIPAQEAFAGMLRGAMGEGISSLTHENLQSRIRAVTLMALSNQRNHMLLSTGNKSELAVGYATLYGDMCGGYNPIKDIYKTKVYEIARWRNNNRLLIGLGPEGRVIPERIFTKEPTAELKPNQKDQDTLPPYEDLDWMLESLVEKQLSVAEIMQLRHKNIKQEEIEKVARMLYASEYKRRQSPPGVKISRMAFGRDRRYPLTNKYRSGA